MQLEFVCGDKQLSQVRLSSLENGECFVQALGDKQVFRKVLDLHGCNIFLLNSGQVCSFTDPALVYPVTLDPITYHHKGADAEESSQ